MTTRAVIVTGAGHGIGRAIALRFARDGWEVIAIDVDEAAIADTRARGGPSVHTLVADTSEPGAGETAVEVARHQAGGVDVLVNNAAVSLGESFLETTAATWRRTVEVNLTGTFLVGQAVAHAMVADGRSGRIVNLASTNSHAAERGTASYVTTKGGVAALTRAMAVDLAPHGILVNAVAPGPIRTERTGPDHDAEPLRTAIARGVPVGRGGTPDEVAGVVAFLAGGDATFLTGATLVVDGGYLAYARFD